jgi:hypothetical protein
MVEYRGRRDAENRDLPRSEIVAFLRTKLTTG